MVGREKAAVQQNPEALARAIALRQLTSSPKSRKQLADKLAAREVPVEVAQIVLDRFEEVQLIDDAEFAKMWVRSRAQSRSLAKGALRRELSEKGISKELADEALAQLSDDDEVSAAEQLVRRKLRTTVDLQDREARDKLCRRLVSMLARKGYQPGLAFSIVNQELDALSSAS